MDTLSIKIALWWLISIVIASQDNNAGVGRHQHLHLHRPQNVFNNSVRLPIVYVYTVVPAVCKGGLPEYIRTSVEQGIDTQPDCDVVLVSNFGDCVHIKKSVRRLARLKLVDSTEIASLRTKEFANLSTNIFQTDGAGELWMTSALRFFILEDLMLTHGYHELIHVEADNMMYGRLMSLLPILRSGYRGLAATPLNTDKSFITASVLWISRLGALLKFNNYLLSLGLNKNQYWTRYLKWLRQYACCKKGGVDPDQHGNGIKPFAINEMSMLAFYHHEHPSEFKLFPVVPAHPYITNRYVANMSDYGPGGLQVGPATGHGVWDPNSWGQLLGGTSSKNGRDKGFTDSSHIAGQAIRLNDCTIRMLCGNQSAYSYTFVPKSVDHLHEFQVHESSSDKNESEREALHTQLQMRVLAYNWHRKYQETRCYSAPFIRCGGPYGTPLGNWTPLWNLHVHSKHTPDYRSASCPCPDRPAAAAGVVDHASRSDEDKSSNRPTVLRLANKDGDVTNPISRAKAGYLLL